jgi:hypothetical protein
MAPIRGSERPIANESNTSTRQLLYTLEHKYLIKDWSQQLPEIEESHRWEIEQSLRAEGKLSTPEAARQTDDAPGREN